jgi:hypothetical protein
MTHMKSNCMSPQLRISSKCLPYQNYVFVSQSNQLLNAPQTHTHHQPTQRKIISVGIFNGKYLIDFNSDRAHILTQHVLVTSLLCPITCF